MYKVANNLLLTIFLIFPLIFNQPVVAQEEQGEEPEEEMEEMVDEEDDEADEEDAREMGEMDEIEDMQAEEEEEPEDLLEAADEEDDRTGHQIVLDYFLEGGPFMFVVLVCLIIGLAVSFERIINLNLKSINTNKFLDEVEAALNSGGVDEAKEVCRNTRGPIASIFYQALDRANEGIEIVEKSIVSYGSVQMGLLERGLVWISLFISVAPMLGFMGTVIGMILAFDAIAEAGDISPSIVADGIKVALLSTVAGLIVAVILQLFYNYLVSKVDNLVNTMEDASISLVDMMLKYNVVKEKEK